MYRTSKTKRRKISKPSHCNTILSHFKPTHTIISPTLPKDLWIVILSIIFSSDNVRAIIKCKRVCKSWYDIILKFIQEKYIISNEEVIISMIKDMKYSVSVFNDLPGVKLRYDRTGDGKYILEYDGTSWKSKELEVKIVTMFKSFIDVYRKRRKTPQRYPIKMEFCKKNITYLLKFLAIVTSKSTGFTVSAYYLNISSYTRNIPIKYILDNLTIISGGPKQSIITCSGNKCVNDIISIDHNDHTLKETFFNWCKRWQYD
jgi:hypothetical protein